MARRQGASTRTSRPCWRTSAASPCERGRHGELRAHAKSTIAERAAHPKLIRVVDVLPTTVIGKLFKPTLIQREVESVFMDEASALGVKVLSAKASQDAKLGLVLRWQAKGDVAALKARLDGFIFRHEQLPT